MEQCFYYWTYSEVTPDQRPYCTSLFEVVQALRSCLHKPQIRG